jgi:putative tricarboxylic transport membrane protein
MGPLEGLAYGFSVALMPANVVACFAGVLVGTIVGILPGIGPVGAMALLLPSTFSLEPATALIMLAGIYYGSMYGGSTTSILVNVPGEAGSVVTAIDGYQMTRNGRAGAALAVAAMGSFVAGSLDVVGIGMAASWLADQALRFGPPEYFAMAAAGLLLLSRLSGGSLMHALLVHSWRRHCDRRSSWSAVTSSRSSDGP